MAKQQKAYRQFLRKFKIPFLAGDTTAKFLFLLLSVFLWFLIKLSSEGYVTEVFFPITYQNVPEDLRLNEQPVSEIKVKVRSLGFDLLKYKLLSLRPIQMDVSSAVRNDRQRYYWLTSTVENTINDEFDENTEVLSIQPDTVFFDFSTVVSKKVKVYLKARKLYSNFKTFYSPPQVSPDSITITGSAAEVDKLDSIFTKPLELKAEEDSVVLQVPLNIPTTKDLRFSKKQVTVKIRYTSLTEGSFEVPVKVVNLPEEYELNVFPERVNLRFQVPLEEYERVSVDDFQLYVDYNEISESEGQRFMTVQMQSVPAYLKKVSFDPKQLEYILIQR